MHKEVELRSLSTSWEWDHCPTVNAGKDSPVGHVSPTETNPQTRRPAPLRFWCHREPILLRYSTTGLICPLRINHSLERSSLTPSRQSSERLRRAWRRLNPAWQARTLMPSPARPWRMLAIPHFNTLSATRSAARLMTAVGSLALFGNDTAIPQIGLWKLGRCTRSNPASSTPSRRRRP